MSHAITQITIALGLWVAVAIAAFVPTKSYQPPIGSTVWNIWLGLALIGLFFALWAIAKGLYRSTLRIPTSPAAGPPDSRVRLYRCPLTVEEYAWASWAGFRFGKAFHGVAVVAQASDEIQVLAIERDTQRLDPLLQMLREDAGLHIRPGPSIVVQPSWT